MAFLAASFLQVFWLLIADTRNHLVQSVEDFLEFIRYQGGIAAGFQNPPIKCTERRIVFVLWVVDGLHSGRCHIYFTTSLMLSP